jgi:predicted TIM-barrel fold metal-dependent hydrolase
MEYRVISTDNHIIEAPNTWSDHIDSEYKDRAPKIMPGLDGGDGWSFDGKPPADTFGLNAVAGRPFEDYKVTGLKLEEILPGSYEGAAHIKDMQSDGVDAAVIYPMSSLKAYNIEDRGFGAALLRGYNDWLLDEFCAADPLRLIGLPLMPVDDSMSSLRAELDRVVAKGARGVFLPYFSRVAYWDRYYESFWAALADSGTVASIHRTSGGIAPLNQTTPNVDDALGLNMAGIVERFFTAVPMFSRIVFTGLFERHPKLKFVDAEVNVGWLPFWAQMMDQEYERQRHWANPPLHSHPSSFIGKNLFVSVLDDHVGFKLARSDPRVVAASMFSTDYPHSTTLYPHTREHIDTLTKDLGADDTSAILAGNAVRVYNLATDPK